MLQNFVKFLPWTIETVTLGVFTPALYGLVKTDSGWFVILAWLDGAGLKTVMAQMQIQTTRQRTARGGGTLELWSGSIVVRM